MKKRFFAAFVTAVLMLTAAPACRAEVEWRFEKALELDAAPLAVAVAAGAQWIFVLTEAGDVHVFSAEGVPADRFHVGEGFDGLTTGPQEDVLYLSNSRDRKVQVVRLDFIREIDLEGSPARGPVDAPAVMVVFTDFECPFCARLAPVLDRVLAQNPGTVRLVFKNFPLRSHPFALKAATAALAAGKMGKFWEFHDLLFQNHDRLSDEKISEIAGALGIDGNDFAGHLRDPAIMEQIRSDYQAGIDAGVRGTPSLFVNGKMVRDRTPEGIQQAIDEALAKKGPGGAGRGAKNAAGGQDG